MTHPTHAVIEIKSGEKPRTYSRHRSMRVAQYRASKATRALRLRHSNALIEYIACPIEYRDDSRTPAIGERVQIGYDDHADQTIIIAPRESHS